MTKATNKEMDKRMETFPEERFSENYVQKYEPQKENTGKNIRYRKRTSYKKAENYKRDRIQRNKEKLILRNEILVLNNSKVPEDKVKMSRAEQQAYDEFQKNKKRIGKKLLTYPELLKEREILKKVKEYEILTKEQIERSLNRV